MRSPTAADMVASWPGFETDFAGLSKDADELLSSEHLGWADIIVVMEKRQKSKLSSQFSAHLVAKRVVVLASQTNTIIWSQPCK
ncbi:phosphotyrosine protein phosphatase [Pseudophaeobacter sp. EL27]|uniref:phosphotyrosine protein phosphatase n=1 Tax=Pseudophaeobacter sp. EL27 TaxID=2107580 RepID=UPI001C200809|nr:phosphotyrosine protein phosphatase [Pseudophaeobacter sp. EL27]